LNSFNTIVESACIHPIQLGNKLTTGISNQLKNQAINKTEGLVNDKANKFLNIFGAGRKCLNLLSPLSVEAGVNWDFVVFVIII
jgi:hypothetical protein